ncbi:MAG: AAA family ATPase [Acidobacteriota bacterium]
MSDYLDRELHRLDILLHREILRLRARYQLSRDEFRGLYVSDQQVDSLVRPPSKAVEILEELPRQEDPPEWAALQFTPFEHDVMLLALARELNLKYETLYAYLQDDVVRKRPTVELALRVCSHADRNVFLPEGRLLSSGLLTATGDSFLARDLTIPLTVLRHLTGLTPESSVPDTAASHHDLLTATAGLPRLFLIESADAQDAVSAIKTACHETHRRLLIIDLHAFDQATRIKLLQRVENCGVCLTAGVDLLPSPGARSFFHELANPAAPIWIVVPPGSHWRGLIPGHAVRVIRLADPAYNQRVQIWNTAAPGAPAAELAARYSIGASQIASASAYARDMLALNNEPRAPNLGDLADAVRAQSESTIGHFARRLITNQTWDDLVLPPATFRQIRELAEAIRHRHTVYDAWGFGRKHHGVEGLKILFAGVSGAGKTMTAGLIGAHLSLDVFRIDLSGVVSKYIGETEKNLDRVFSAARGSQSILFFDEADALFGKRSEVKDAHDRYANIEVAYLLQKFEEHDGTVILATNLRRNIDDAFSRRLHYVIEFPVPDEDHRLKLWRNVFPGQTPLGEDVDFPFLAVQFQLTGGDIRNVALEAAFLAAQDGGVITMRQLACALSRQLLKQGKAPSLSDFKQYYALLQP